MDDLISDWTARELAAEMEKQGIVKPHASRYCLTSAATLLAQIT
jgi:hypothetical protein